VIYTDQEIKELHDRMERGEPVDVEKLEAAIDQKVADLRRQRIDWQSRHADKTKTYGFYTKKHLREIDQALEEGKKIRKALERLKYDLRNRDSSGASREVLAAGPMGIPPSPPLPDLPFPLNSENFVVASGAGKHMIGIWGALIEVTIKVPAKGTTHEVTAEARNVAELLINASGEKFDASGFDQELAKVSPAAAIAKLFMQGGNGGNAIEEEG
jgi:hypothetical protein